MVLDRRWHSLLGLLPFTTVTLTLLSCLPSASAQMKTAADYFVHDLPGAPEGPLLKMHAG